MSNGSEVIVEIGQQTTEAVGENREALAEEPERIRRDEDLSEHARGRLTDEARRRKENRLAWCDYFNLRTGGVGSCVLRFFGFPDFVTGL